MTQAISHSSFLHRNYSKEFRTLVTKRFIAENIFLLLLQFIGLLANTLTVWPFSIWLASGTACAFVCMRGYSVLPGVWLGSLLAYLIVNMSWKMSVLSACTFTFQAWFIVFVLRSCLSPSFYFISIKKYISFVFLSMVVTCVCSNTILFFENGIFSEFNLIAWLANFLGINVFSFGIVALDMYFSQISELKKLNIFFGAILCVISIGIILFLMVNNHINFLMPHIFLLFLAILISMFYGWCAILFLVNLYMLLQTMLCYFGVHLETTQILMLQIFIFLTLFLGISISICKRN